MTREPRARHDALTSVLASLVTWVDDPIARRRALGDALIAVGMPAALATMHAEAIDAANAADMAQPEPGCYPRYLAAVRAAVAGVTK